ncbi:serine hydrolase [Rubellicoccus peritrichatus]|uniref:Serine hydrolase n=1 Tax=Rubellicoccus peritrichatus TaxID=3080537 RepID=A0AAQ3L866_9BACT|nr:serine hydrolase [Puniceicoccus sp. CR14]WOO39699.1 serine hydrolase [Puniceicoccus sp. CR14]
MKAKIFCISVFLFSGMYCVHAQSPGVNDKVGAHITEKVNRELNQSIIVGIVTSAGDEYITAGTISEENPTAPTKDTIYEIGSITKVFTAASAADLIKQRQLTWKTTAGALLPQNAQPPNFEGQPINLHHLATHSSGLARLPLNLNPEDPQNPYKDYDEEALYKGVKLAGLPYPPGSFYLYSNFGYGLLGHLLELRTGDPYETIVKEHVTEPLGMANTAVTLTEEQQVLLAPGHQGKKEVPGWDLNAMSGAGALKSNAEDLIKFLKAQMGMIKNPKAAAMGSIHAPILPTGSKDTMVGYAWQITRSDGTTVYWHNGQTGGYASFIGFNPSRRIGVVVLSNTNQSVDEIGFYVLAPDVYPLGDFQPLPRVPISTLERYVGTYEIAPGAEIKVTREDNRLYATITGTPTYRIFPISETRFGFAEGNLILDFDSKAKRGKVQTIKVEEKLRSYGARRIKEE